MKSKKCYLLILLLVLTSLSGITVAQEWTQQDTKFFRISMPANCEILTRLKFEQGLYDSDPTFKAIAYNKNTESFSSDKKLELVCIALSGKYLIHVSVFDINEEYVTTGREEYRILSRYDKLFDAIEAENDSIIISRAKSFRSDGAYYVYADVVNQFSDYDEYSREYYFTFPWKGNVKMFQFIISTLDESLDLDCISIAESCLESLSIKY